MIACGSIAIYVYEFVVASTTDEKEIAIKGLIRSVVDMAVSKILAQIGKESGEFLNIATGKVTAKIEQKTMEFAMSIADYLSSITLSIMWGKIDEENE